MQFHYTVIKFLQLFCAGILCFCSQFSFANQAFLIQYFQDLHQMQASFTQVTQQGKKRENSKGQLWLGRDLGLRFLYQQPFKQDIVLNRRQNKVWTYDQDLAQVIIKSAQLEDRYNPVSFLLTSEPLDNLFTIRVEKDFTRYYLTPKTSQEQLGMRSLTIYFKNKQLDQFKVVNDSGYIEFKLHDLVLNPSFSNALFVFKPQDYPKIDIIDETISSKKR